MQFDRRTFLAALASSAAAGLLPHSSFGSTAQSGDAALLDKLAHDPLRPQFHLLPPHNWMNDPNGPIWWKGSYHLFYQLNPHAAVWGDMHWGHAVSADMIHWRHQPIALAPTPGGSDSEGCFSGSAIVHDGVPTFICTGVQNSTPELATIRDGSDKLRETQMLATAEDDGLLHWKKREQPIIALPPSEVKVTGFRDPCPWREADGWYLGVGSGERGKGGCVLLYRSQDLLHWDYLHKLTEGKPNGKQAANPCDSGEMWECPDFFALGDRHCLFYSTEGKVIWTTGHYDIGTHRYTPTQHGILDHGAYYAPKSFLAPDGRRILWGWIQETRSEAEFAAAGWSGAMALPRVLTVDAEGQLQMRVAAEAESLRSRGEHAEVTSDKPFRRALPTLSHELALKVATPPQSVNLRLVSGGATAWELSLDFAGGTARCGETSFALPKASSSVADLRWFLDGSVIESLIGEREALTRRVYTLSPSDTTLEISITGASHVDIDLWPLKPISPNRLTT
jgi:beta-fructofuranosidase